MDDLVVLGEEEERQQEERVAVKTQLGVVTEHPRVSKGEIGLVPVKFKSFK